MAKKTDGLLLTLSEQEVTALWTIIDAPAEPVRRQRWTGELSFLLILILALGVIRPGLAAAIMKWAALLIGL